MILYFPRQYNCACAQITLWTLPHPHVTWGGMKRRESIETRKARRVRAHTHTQSTRGVAPCAARSIWSWFHWACVVNTWRSTTCRCHKILGTPMKMGTRGSHFPGRMGTPLRKWGPLLSDFRARVSRKASSRPVSSLIDTCLRKWIKWNNPVAVFQSKFRMENDAQLEQGRFTFNDIHRYLRDPSKTSQVFLYKGCRSHLCRWIIK